MTQSVRAHLLNFAVPIGTVGLAFVLTESIPTFRNSAPFFLFLTAVLLSTWYGGWFSGLLATVLAAGATGSYFMQAHQSPFGQDSLIRWSLFVLISLIISSLHASRTRATQELQRSRQRLSLAIDSAQMGVWDYNLITRELWWSKTLEMIYGRTAGDFPKTYGQFFGCIHFDDQPLFNRAITRTIDEGIDYDIAYRIVLPDGALRRVQTRGRLFFNSALLRRAHHRCDH